ncbi:hypothetical protein [Streptomyces sp. URMC 123]|uniref:hypothetical protein n=1 Tax=Streptomyces sp. URMC 123 TaxID=3423403 RepID=UPI003F1E0990
MRAHGGLSLWLGALAALLALSACQREPGGAPGGPPADAPRRSVSPQPSGYGATFLGEGECGRRAGEGFAEAPCAGARAVARVVARYEGRQVAGPRCPEHTDFVLHITEHRPAVDEDGDGRVPQGYACMRNLRPPHPGDPGGGGGPRTVVGDCLYAARHHEVKETACDGSGERAPEFRLTVTVPSRDRCPPSTALYVDVGGERPVGCARRL